MWEKLGSVNHFSFFQGKCNRVSCANALKMHSKKHFVQKSSFGSTLDVKYLSIVVVIIERRAVAASSTSAPRLVSNSRSGERPTWGD